MLEKGGSKLEGELDLVLILKRLRQVDAICSYLAELDKSQGDDGACLFKDH